MRTLVIPESPHKEQNAEAIKQAVARFRSDVCELLGREPGAYGSVAIEVVIANGRIDVVRPTATQTVKVRSIA